MTKTTAHLSRYAAVVAHAAAEALDAAGPAPAADEAAGRMAMALPAARRLLDPAAVDPAAVLEGLRRLTTGPLRYNDSLGHTRPAYFALLVHLHAAALDDDTPGRDAVAAAVARLEPRPDDPADELWRALCLSHLPGQDPAPMVDAVVSRPGPNGELHAFVEGDDLLDAWWYRELVGLHALFRLAHGPLGRDAWRARARGAVLYHLDNTQPDHTTAQPWAVAAFLTHPESIPFGEQQLHDARSYWTHGGPGASVIPGLLLADAAGTMMGLDGPEAGG